MNTTATRPFRVMLRLPTMPSSVIRWYPSTRQKMDNSYACTLNLAAQQRLRRRLFSILILNLRTKRTRFLAHLRGAAIAQKGSPADTAWPSISTSNIDRFGNLVLRQKRRAAKLPSAMRATHAHISHLYMKRNHTHVHWLTSTIALRGSTLLR